jgi:hypothetical protein
LYVITTSFIQLDVYVLLLLALSATFGKAASRFQKTECPAPASQNLGNINTFSYIPPIDGKVLRWFDYPNLAIVLGSGVAWTMDDIWELHIADFGFDFWTTMLLSN